ncbi:MAG: adenine phosphoribosyltransferase [Verrucomicrobiota bacterium]|nr:adenine phosphoribosyltransferase [Verrucomicrobiota bacterium]
MTSAELSAFLKPRIRTVRGWPKAGVNFRDVTTLFSDPAAFRAVIEALAADCAQFHADVIAGVDARGFIVGGALAYHMGKPFVLLRKKGKLPFKTASQDYSLEYGSATIELHLDACKPGDRVLIVDDLIATGGTLLAAAKLFKNLGGDVSCVAAIIDLPELGGSKRLREAGLRVHTLCSFDEHE